MAPIKVKLDKKTAELFAAAGLVSADSDEAKELLSIKYFSTGHSAFDYSAGGGIPVGQMTLLAGWEGTLKSSFALHLCSQIQKVDERPVYYFDGENAVSERDLVRFNVDPSKLEIAKTRKGEVLLDTAQAVAENNLASMIVIDSVKAYGMEQEIEKDTSAYNIGIKALRFGNKMNVIAGFAAMHGITLLIINQYTEDPGAMFGDGLRLSGGNWQKYLPYLRIDLAKSTKKENQLFDDEGVKIGQMMICRIKKSKSAEFDAKDGKRFNFYYEGGLNEVEGTISLAIDQGVITRGGSVYTFGDKKINGKNNLVDSFIDDADAYLALKEKVDEIIEKRRYPHGA